MCAFVHEYMPTEQVSFGKKHMMKYINQIETYNSIIQLDHIMKYVINMLYWSIIYIVKYTKRRMQVLLWFIGSQAIPTKVLLVCLLVIPLLHKFIWIHLLIVLGYFLYSSLVSNLIHTSQFSIYFFNSCDNFNRPGKATSGYVLCV